MFPKIGEHRGWSLERRPPGFEFTPGLLGKITTFVAVHPEGGFAIFAFMYSFLVSGGPAGDEDTLADMALMVVRASIDDGTAQPDTERTYELAEDGWRPVIEPGWWISVLARP